jgi:hypothetical protein
MKRCWLVVALIGAMALAWSGVHAAAREEPKASPIASPVTSPVSSPEVPPTPRLASVTFVVTVNLTDRGFDPTYIQSTNGHDLTITLINTGTRPHSFHVDEFNVHETLSPGEQAVVVIRAPEELGDFRYYSDAPGDDDYEGELTFYI